MLDVVEETVVFTRKRILDIRDLMAETIANIYKSAYQYIKVRPGTRNPVEPIF